MRAPAASRTQYPIEQVIVSPEMRTVIGARATGDAASFPDATLLVFDLGGVGAPSTLQIVADTAQNELGSEHDNHILMCFVKHDALTRLFGWSARETDTQHYHLTTELRAIALALVECPMAGPPRETYRIGKSIELLCETMRALTNEMLVPVAGNGRFNQIESRRLSDARRMIDERWAEKLTLDGLARACGTNRAKLTRGFRDMFRCTVAEAIAEKRLTEARRALLTTDLPVSSIGFASGYLNNASFSRAFGRRFGVSPSEYRICRAA